jgi:protein TonB
VRGLLISFLTVLCLLPPAAGQRLDGDTSELFMEAIVDERPALLSAPKVKYPEVLKRAGIEGEVIVQAIIDTTGRAERGSVKVLQSPNPGFDENAKEYVRKAMFRPARIHGRTVRVVVQVPVQFRSKNY